MANAGPNTNGSQNRGNIEIAEYQEDSWTSALFPALWRLWLDWCCQNWCGKSASHTRDFRLNWNNYWLLWLRGFALIDLEELHLHIG